MVVAASRFDVPLVFAGLVVTSLMGIMMYAMAAVDRKAHDRLGGAQRAGAGDQYGRCRDARVGRLAGASSPRLLCTYHGLRLDALEGPQAERLEPGKALSPSVDLEQTRSLTRHR